MRKWLIQFVILFTVPLSAQTATITWTNVHQTMQGFGAYNAFVGTAMNPYDTLFFSTLGYSLLRASLPLDDSCSAAPSTSCGTGQSNTTDMQSCIANGCQVWATVSSPPADMKTNGSVYCTVQGSTLITGDYGAYATYISNYIASLNTYYSVPLYAISPQNEPDTCTNGLETSEAFSSFSASNFDTFVKTNLGPTLAANGQSSTLIMIPETGQWADITTFAANCMADPSCAAYVPITAYHDYDFASAPTNPYSTSKYWETEVSTFSAWDPSITDALTWAGIVHTALVNGATAWHYFWYVDPTGTNENDGLINPAMTTPISQRTYGIAQWAKFVRPGWERIDATANPVSGVDVTAFKAPSGGNFAIVAVNTNGATENVTFSFSGFTSGTVTPYITSGTQSLTALSPVSAGSSLTYTLPASSIMTFTGTNGGGTPSCPASVPSTITTCYFIAANGNDSNNGTSESTPWQHAPGMSTCTNNCAAANPSSTQGFIFRGGDTWHFGNSGLSPYTGGNWNEGNWAGGNCSYEGDQSGCIYWGVDKTWFASSSWVRPALTGDNPTNTSLVSSCPYQTGGANTMVTLYNGAWLDNFEITGLCSSRNPASTGPSTDFMVSYGGTGQIIESNLYVHGWTATTAAGTSNNTIPCTLLGGSTQGTSQQSFVANVIDGADSNPGACAWGLFPTFLHFVDNIVRYTTQGVGQGCHDIHDNIFEYISNPVLPTHGNILECNDDGQIGTPNVFYNNTMRHINSNFFSSGQVGWWFCPNNTAEYWFNNLVYDTGGYDDGDLWAVAGTTQYPGCTGGGAAPNPSVAGQFMFNNSLSGAIQPCHMSGSNISGGAFTTVVNEHLMNTPFDGSGCTGGASDGSNIQQTWTQSNTQGYTSGSAGVTDADTCANDSTKPCTPVSSSGSTVLAGHNETSAFCNAIEAYSGTEQAMTDAAAACKNSTTNGCFYNTSNHSMQCPNQVAVARPTSTAWDSGAYQFSGGTPPPIASVSPSTLAFGSQTVGTTSGPLLVTITNTGTGSLVFTNYALTTGTQFAIGPNTCSSTYANSLPASLSCTISLTFAPTSGGVKADTLTLTNNSGGTAGTTQTVSLSGTGVTGPTWTVNAHNPNFTCSWASAGTTQSCSASITAVAGQLLTLGVSAWSNGATMTFNSASGDSFVHPSGCAATSNLGSKYFYTDLVYILAATGGTHTYEFTLNATAGSGAMDVDPISVSVSSGTAAFDGCAIKTYANCNTTCISPVLTPSGTSDYIFQIGASGYGPIAAPGAPYTNPSDVDPGNVDGIFLGAVNQSTVTSYPFPANTANYPAGTVAAFKPSSQVAPSAPSALQATSP